MSFILNSLKSLTWIFESLWKSLGLSGRTGRLLVLGLDNAGKTTLLQVLQTGSIRTVPPTDRPQTNEIQIAGVKFLCWDLGGHEAVRYLWQDYYSDETNQDSTTKQQISAIAFVVDAADSERLEEAGYELDALVHEGPKVPMAVLLNKTDLPMALSSEEIVQRMELDRLCKEHGSIRHFRISVLEQTGLQPPFRWIAQAMRS